MIKNNKCVYLHKDSEGIVRYVGSGTIERAFKRYASSNRGKPYMEYVLNFGKLSVEIIAKDLSKVEAEDLERQLYDLHEDTILNCKKPSSEKILTREMFEDFLYYDETSPSCLRWKVDIYQTTKANTQAGGVHTKTGYFLICLHGIRYWTHRIIMVLNGIDVNGLVVDHIDGNKSNNKIKNLRAVSNQVNNQFNKLNCRNKSGVTGVSLSNNGYWVASWHVDGVHFRKHFPIANYATSNDAKLAAISFRDEMVRLHYTPRV